MPVNLCFRLDDVIEWWNQARRPDETDPPADDLLNPSDAAELAPFGLAEVVRD